MQDDILDKMQAKGCWMECSDLFNTLDSISSLYLWNTYTKPNLFNALESPVKFTRLEHFEIDQVEQFQVDQHQRVSK